MSKGVYPLLPGAYVGMVLCYCIATPLSSPLKSPCWGGACSSISQALCSHSRFLPCFLWIDCEDGREPSLHYCFPSWLTLHEHGPCISVVLTLNKPYHLLMSCWCLYLKCHLSKRQKSRNKYLAQTWTTAVWPCPCSGMSSHRSAAALGVCNLSGSSLF